MRASGVALLFYFTIISLKYPFGRVMVSRSDAIALLSLQGKAYTQIYIVCTLYISTISIASKGVSLTHTQIDIIFTVYSLVGGFDILFVVLLVVSLGNCHTGMAGPYPIHALERSLIVNHLSFYPLLLLFHLEWMLGL